MYMASLIKQIYMPSMRILDTILSNLTVIPCAICILKSRTKYQNPPHFEFFGFKNKPPPEQMISELLEM